VSRRLALSFPPMGAGSKPRRRGAATAWCVPAAQRDQGDAAPIFLLQERMNGHGVDWRRLWLTGNGPSLTKFPLPSLLRQRYVITVRYHARQRLCGAVEKLNGGVATAPTIGPLYGGAWPSRRPTESAATISRAGASALQPYGQARRTIHTTLQIVRGCCPRCGLRCSHIGRLTAAKPTAK